MRKLLRLLPVLAVLATAPAYASQSDPTTDGPLATKFSTNGPGSVVPYVPAGWETLTSGTNTATGQIASIALRPGFTAYRFTAYCTYTGAASSAQIIFFVSEQDPDGNLLQPASGSGADSTVASPVLAGAGTFPLVLEVGGYTKDSTAATATRTYTRRGHLPEPYFGIWMSLPGTFTTVSCRWFLYGFRG